ncbi:MAG: RluA family pseudouridine synthase [Clostridia bacterium]|nr:RluA family pseudouridine synthase [Clostridia bacterium]
MNLFTAGKNDDGCRVDAFLRRMMPDAPQSLIYKYIRTNKVKLNGKKPKPETIIAAGDEIKYFGDAALLSQKTSAPMKATMPKVLYEDENIVLLYKPAGVACQPDRVRTKDTMVDRLRWYLYQSGAFQPEGEHGFAPALCNRLDVNTRGIVIGAKNMAALREMNARIKQGEVRKFYLCRVVGKPPKAQGVIRTHLQKDAKTNISRVSDTGKYAETQYRLLSSDAESSLLEIELITGRSHQIRVHMQSLGCPIVGDPKYGKGGKGQDLFAYKLQFAFQTPSVILRAVSGKTFVAP